MNAISDRANANPSLRFYVFDNLLAQEQGTSGNLYRFDTLEEAIRCYQAQPTDWMTALGARMDGGRELDLAQRRGGVSVLITDYQELPAWLDSPSVQEAVRALTRELRFPLKSDRHLLGRPILVPLDRPTAGNDPYLIDKTLRMKEPSDIQSSINEAFVPGEGWMDRAELEAFLRLPANRYPNVPTVSLLNVSYRADDGSIGQMDITPEEFAFLRQKAQDREMSRVDSPLASSEALHLPLYALTETHENSDAIRETHLLGLSSDKELLRSIMAQRIQDDPDGFFQTGGFAVKGKDRVESAFQDFIGFVSYDISEVSLLDGQDLQRMQETGRTPFHLEKRNGVDWQLSYREGRPVAGYVKEGEGHLVDIVGRAETQDYLLQWRGNKHLPQTFPHFEEAFERANELILRERGRAETLERIDLAPLAEHQKTPSREPLEKLKGQAKKRARQKEVPRRTDGTRRKTQHER